MNIGLVSPYDFATQGGVTEHITHLAKQLRAAGHTVKILAPYSTDKGDVPDDVYALGAVTPVPANGSVARISLSPDLGRSIRAILRAERFDIIHLHEPLMPTVPWLVLRYSDSPNVGTFHAYGESSPVYAMGRPILRRFYNRLHGRVAVSESAYDFISQYFDGTFEIIPNGVDVDTFSAPLEPINWMRDGRPTILFVGRFEEARKGLRWLLQALPIVEPYFPDLRLVVAGSGDPEEMADWLPLRDQTRPDRIIYRSAGSVMEVEFTGFVPAADLPRYYQSSDVYCAPSTGGESFGIVLLESMAAGTPVLASRISGYASVLTHGREGFLTEPKQPASIAAGLIRLLSDSALRAQMAEAGLRTARQYDWPIVAARLIAYYEQIRSQNPSTVRPTRRRGLARTRVTNGL
ncbi:MAG TPA: glycosyltransferase family 4 protein [Chloroflexia bacterium]|nr:glycosyltransferase family 4 protein [Chloroflexia bacterium]